MGSQHTGSDDVPPGVRRFRRVLRVLGVLLAVLVGVPLSLYVGHGVVGSVQTSALRAEVGAEVRAERAVAQPEVLALRDRQRAALPAAPAHSWAALECDFASRDAGWIVQAYQQTCELRTMDFLPVADRSEAEQVSAGLPSGLFGDEQEHSGGPHCQPLRATGGGREPSTELLWTPAATLPDGPDRCYRVMTSRPGQTADVLEPFDAATLDPTTDWLVVVSTRTVMDRRELGCSPWSVLFCSEPFDEPVLG
ncbi:hypothetical protein [Auraticoccus monumenti]|uniref:Uncharacterized protein n=1 Tax=Auraticoccus monumenti TaxID=675864 RepID=A0A1G7CK25_9ACTN|nr:hypothetical protein [Auraticoccus monumenti]SDE39591.1 hypothetical protein SAMN04489747_3294 [Auraticoccus monumenti]